MAHSYLTAGLPGTGGAIKEAPDDFLVTEIPLYEPCGSGEHTYVELEKRGIGTLEALRRLAKALGISDRDLGYAGMKDAVGVTRQHVSLPRVPPERVLALEIPGVRILSALRHGNKLRLGHLRGNRFRIRVRQVEGDALARAEAILQVLAARGVPNFFGGQRYGVQGNSHLVGRAMIRGDFCAAVTALIGDPGQVRDERWRQAIEAFRNGDPAESLRLFPGHCRGERDLLQRLVKHPDDYQKALNAVHPRLRKLYLSAFQSFLFDRYLEMRLDTMDRVLAGDLAMKHANGACFAVTDASVEAPRAAAFEISPTGPMFGSRMTLPGGKPLEWETDLLRTEGLSPEDFDRHEGWRLDGERRPLRVPVSGLSCSMEDDSLLLGFELPKGAYATTLLGEVMKSDQVS